MKKIRRKFACCKRRIGEAIVQNDLAMTPSDVLKMAESGIPASAQMVSQMVDGHLGSDWSLNLEDRRGIDIAQMWQESMDSRKRIKSASDAAKPVVSSNADGV